MVLEPQPPPSTSLSRPREVQDRSYSPSWYIQEPGLPVHPAPSLRLQYLSRRCMPTAFLISAPNPQLSITQSLFQARSIIGLALSSYTELQLMEPRLNPR